jgi:hypothetical protein
MENNGFECPLSLEFVKYALPKRLADGDDPEGLDIRWFASGSEIIHCTFSHVLHQNQANSTETSFISKTRKSAEVRIISCLCNNALFCVPATHKIK